MHSSEWRSNTYYEGIWYLTVGNMQPWLLTEVIQQCMPTLSCLAI
jgi:hypothetical protein